MTAQSDHPSTLTCGSQGRRWSSSGLVLVLLLVPQRGPKVDFLVFFYSGCSLAIVPSYPNLCSVPPPDART